jgi:hypothetical protein
VSIAPTSAVAAKSRKVKGKVKPTTTRAQTLAPPTTSVPAATAPSATNPTTTGIGTTTSAPRPPSSVVSSVAPSFELRTAVFEQAATTGAPVEFAVEVLRPSGYAGAVDLKIDSAAPGITGVFSPSSTTANSVLTLSADATVVTGGYEVKFSGRAGSVVRDTSVKLNVQARGDVSVSASPSFFVLSPGYAIDGTISVKLETEPSVPVKLSIEGLPAGVAMSVSQGSVLSGTQFRISVPPAFSVGTPAVFPPAFYDFQLVATRGALRQVVPMRVVPLDRGGVGIGSDFPVLHLSANGTAALPLNVYASIKWEDIPKGVQTTIVGGVTTFRATGAAPGPYVLRLAVTPYGSGPTVNVPIYLSID